MVLVWRLTHSVHYCYKRCKLCKQVHDAGKCEAFTELASLLRSKVDKKDLTPMLQSVADHQLKLGWFLSGCHRKVKSPEDREMGFVNTTETVEGNDGSLGENAVDGLDVGEDDGHLTEASVSSREPNEASSRSLARTAKLLPGERLGWWSSQRYDKRKRMRAVIMGAIDDTRTRILLDTGAYVSVISAAYAKRLRLREVPDHGRSLEVRGINPGVQVTRRQTLV
ncbi:LOW QUALITY PROTEIN: hypothetical protein PHMEG_00019050 [Phytophthora megakarya]|uniref:Peptidase A2 domain-containing protein n=1 Tax=Phytophthora megakarya TaxID=4795 RepID=A0A225VSW7_9STRA|nr:LOW QUALITY PROTEIN: hypothetical protein PHMEG_00019050 [Phytophthora megakarya]